MPDQNTLSLVLGSGGARGLAHIGAIRCLQDHDFDVRYVAGSSIGALVGGVYAAGKLDDYEQWVRELQKSDIIRLLDWSFESGAVFRGDRIVAKLRELIGDPGIDELPIGYTAVATDLSVAGRSSEVWFNSGPLFDAIRASMAVPTIFAPVQADGRLLVDGGVINPVPVAPTLNDHTSVTLAVDLNGPDDGSLPELEDSPGGVLQAAFQQSIGRYIERFWPGGEEKPERLGFADLATRSMEAMQASLTQFKLAATPPSCVVAIPRNLCGFFDYHRAAEIIDFGYERTEKVLSREAGQAVGERDGERQES